MEFQRIWRNPSGAMLLLVVVVAVACTPGGVAPTGSQPGTSSASNGDPSPLATSSEPVTVEWYSALNEPEPYVRAYKEIIASYELAHPNVTIHVTWMGREISTKIRPFLQSGPKPDIIENDGATMYAGLMKDGLIADLTPYYNQPAYESTTSWKDTWVEGSLEPLSIEGQLNTVPFWTSATQIFYDERLFTANGLTVPQTWDDLMAICASLKAKNVECFGQEGTVSDYNFYWMSELVYRLLGPGALLAAATDKTGETWLQPGYLEAAKKEHSLKANGYFAEGFEGSQYPSAQVGWVNGKTAFYLLSDWLPSELADTTPTGFVFRSFPFPTVDGKGSVTDVELWPYGFSLFKDAPHAAEAVDFMKYFTSPDVFAPLQTDFGVVSPIKTTHTPKGNSDSQANIQSATGVHVFRDGVGGLAPDYTQTVLLSLNDKLILNTISPEEFIQQISQQTKDYWTTQ